MILVITFLLTVLIDLAVAVQVGVILSAIVFLKRMTDKTTVAICQNYIKENNNEIAETHMTLRSFFRKDIPSDVFVFEIRGPFFYSVADLLDEALLRLDVVPRVFILRIDQTPLIDASGLRAIKQFGVKCKNKNIIFIISDVDESKMHLFRNAGIEEVVGEIFLKT